MTAAPRPQLATKFTVGAFWGTLDFGVKFAGNLIVGIILSRLLTPAHFGLFAVLTAFSGFASLLSSAGLSSAVIQFRNLDEGQISRLFWLNVAIGGVCSLLFICLSPVVAWWAHSPAAAPAAAAIGADFFISSAGVVPNGILQRRMHFRSIFIANGSATVVSGILAIVAAVVGAGYWALIIQVLSRSFVCTLGVGALSRTAFWGRPSKVPLNGVWGFSGHLTAFNAVNYWARNVDSVAIGHFMGEHQLGLYNRAYSLMLYPLTLLSIVVHPVLHPTLAQVQQDVPRMRTICLKVTKVIALLSLPFATTCALLSPEVVVVAWGPQWTAAVPVFRILCAAGAVQAVISTFGTIFVARGRTGTMLTMGIFNSCLICTGILSGLAYGIRGVAAGYTVAYFLTVIPTGYYVITKLLESNIGQFLRTIRTSLLSSAAIGLALACYDARFRGDHQPALHLAGGILVATTILAAFVVSLERPVLGEISGILAKLRPGIKKPSSAV